MTINELLYIENCNGNVINKTTAKFPLSLEFTTIISFVCTSEHEVSIVCLNVSNQKKFEIKNSFDTKNVQFKTFIIDYDDLDL